MDPWIRPSSSVKLGPGRGSSCCRALATLLQVCDAEEGTRVWFTADSRHPAPSRPITWTTRRPVLQPNVTHWPQQPPTCCVVSVANLRDASSATCVALSSGRDGAITCCAMINQPSSTIMRGIWLHVGLSCTGCIELGVPRAGSQALCRTLPTQRQRPSATTEQIRSVRCSNCHVCGTDDQVPS